MKFEDIPILMYHEIGEQDNPWCVSLNNFKEQMFFLKENGYQTISLTELEQGIKGGKNLDENEDPGKKYVIITFDDGRKGVYTHAYPLLKKLGFTATTFVVPNWVEGKEVPEIENYSSVMDWEELRELSKEGFEIGSHSNSHQNLTRLDFNSLKFEIGQSQKIIEEKINQKPNHFSYPLGVFNDEVISAVNEHYLTAVSVVRGFQRSPGNYARQWIQKTTPLEQFRKLLSKPTISLCLIVKDEEKYLKQCLDSVKDIVDEIIIVDTGSTDQTKEIAAKFTDKIFDFTWVDDFAAARNESLKHATGDWLLILDADEIISSEDHLIIREAVNAWEIAGFRIMTRNYSDDSSSSGWQPAANDDFLARDALSTKSFQGWFPSLKVRLFQNKEKIKFKGRVHELVDHSIEMMSGKILTLPLPIHHYGAGGSSEKYLELTKKKIAEEPKNAKAYYELGVQYKQLKQFVLAERAFKQSLELDSSPVPPQLNLAIVQQKQKNYASAIENFNKILQKNPKNADAYFGLGFCHFMLNDLPLSEANFKLAIEHNPSFVDAYINLGAIYEKTGNFSPAEEMLQKVINISPKNARAHYNLGVVYEKNNELSAAISCYQEAIKLNYWRKSELQAKIEKMKQILD